MTEEICRHIKNFVTAIFLAFCLTACGILIVVIHSDGLLPKGICQFVHDDSGLLRLNPNRMGTVQYSCNPDFWFGAKIAVLVSMPLSVFIFAMHTKIIRKKHNSHAKR